LQSQYIKGHQEKEKSSSNYEGIILSHVSFIKCPIKTSLGVLGEKWTILITRDIVFLKINRFNLLLESIQGLTPLLDKIIYIAQMDYIH